MPDIKQSRTTYTQNVTLGDDATDAIAITGRLTGSQGAYFAERVGVGTATPISKLDVAGKLSFTSEQSTPTAPADGKGWLYTKTDGKIYWQSADVAETDLTSTSADPGGTSGQVQYNDDGEFSGSSSLSFDITSGSLGIGTSTFDSSASYSLVIGNGAGPASGSDGQCYIYAKDMEDTVFLLHMEGSNGGTSFSDSSTSDHTVTANGDTNTSTTQFKFGLTSGYFDGTGDYLSVSSHADFQFGADDYTIEMWVRPTSLPGGTYQVLLSTWNSNTGYDLRLYGSSLSWYAGAGTINITAGTLVAGEWNHIAVARNEMTVRLFVNGAIVDSASSTYDHDQTNDLWIGSRAGSTPFTGYIDDVRILKDRATYISDFSVPVATLPANSSELYVMDEAGNETNISPHNINNEWEFFSKNKKTGRCVRVNMENMIKKLEAYTGEEFLEEWYEE